MTISDPIFVRGMSRSGGTLMCTLLDAHREIAMSYELYPSLLEADEEIDLHAVAKLLDRAKPGKNLKGLLPTKGLTTFVVRAGRGGLSPADAARLMHQHFDEGYGLADLAGRFRLVELFGLAKMHRLGRRRWGMKCTGAYEDYLGAWPKAQFLDMLRDGRDVLASQLNTGAFEATPAGIAQSWAKTHRRFEDMAAAHPRQFRLVRYEDLTQEPDLELRALCEFLHLPFDESMLRHNELDLSVFKVSHLSGERIARSIDTSKIGRWKRDLSEAQIAEFMAGAGDALRRFGYV